MDCGVEHLLLSHRHLSHAHVGIASKILSFRGSWSQVGASRNVGRPVSFKPAPLRNSRPKLVSKGRGTLWFHPNLDSSLWLHGIPGDSWRSQVWGQVSAVVQATSLVCTAVESAKSRKDVSPPAEGCIGFSPKDRARLESQRPRQRPVVQTQLFVYPTRCNIRMKKVPPHTHQKNSSYTLFICHVVMVVFFWVCCIYILKGVDE